MDRPRLYLLRPRQRNQKINFAQRTFYESRLKRFLQFSKIFLKLVRCNDLVNAIKCTIPKLTKKNDEISLKVKISRAKKIFWRFFSMMFFYFSKNQYWYANTIYLARYQFILHIQCTTTLKKNKNFAQIFCQNSKTSIL